jgi:ketosteroid isomerase-like protein
MTTPTMTPSTRSTDDDDRPEADPAAVAGAFYEAFLADDLLTASGLVAPDAVLHVPGSHPLAGDHAGIEAILEFVVASRALLGPGDERISVVDLAGGDTHATVLCQVTGERPDRVVMHNRTVHVLRVDDGRIVEIWFHNWDQPSVDAFWS